MLTASKDRLERHPGVPGQIDLAAVDLTEIALIRLAFTVEESFRSMLQVPETSPGISSDFKNRLIGIVLVLSMEKPPQDTIAIIAQRVRDLPDYFSYLRELLVQHIGAEEQVLVPILIPRLSIKSLEHLNSLERRMIDVGLSETDDPFSEGTARKIHKLKRLVCLALKVVSAPETWRMNGTEKNIMGMGECLPWLHPVPQRTHAAKSSRFANSRS